MCELTSERLEQLLNGELDPAEAVAVERHLTEDCTECDSLLNQLGLDEETLALALAAAHQPDPHPASVERVWRQVNTPPRRRWRWAFGGLVTAAAAAALLVVLAPPDPYTGVKGDTHLPRGGVALSWVDDATAELRYNLERDAFVTLLHQHGEGEPEVVYGERVPAAQNGVLSQAGGAFGWSFAGEPGIHLFVLVVSEAPLPAGDVLPLVRDEWLELPDGWTLARVSDQDVGVSMVRVVVP